ncbi:unnamed protein product [Schistosoma margrebowiei]|uniref:Little elongation complex subunit 2 C-terminal domain-containing protein n=1 Tax=Schistosoma margrebowiei TaxID=48269 RepID=A0AA84Z903_9TREM|nr:unnamed protein product [Schistosoma margrebowiei]
MELQAEEQTLHINTLPSFYKFRGTTKSVTNFSTITFTCIDFLQRDSFIYKVPSIEMLSVNKQIDTAYYFEKMLPFPTSVYKQIHHSVEYVVLLTENVLNFLFLLKALVGVYVPFDVTVENSDTSFSRKTIQFGNIILTSPFSPRVRARLFYESLVKQLCFEHISGDQEQSKCALTINTVVEKINISSPRTLRSSTKAQEYDLSVNKLDPTEVLSDTDDELRIDLDEQNSDDHSSKKFSSSICDPGNVASFCTVVERSTNKQQENTNSLSVIDFSSTPASPTDETPKSPCFNQIIESKSIIHSPSPQIIPLEPVKITCELSQDLSPSETISPSKRVTSNSSTSNKINKTEVNQESNQNSVKAYSYSSLKLGNKNLLVQFFDTIWSNNESCQACKTSPSDGQCPLWPSCNTRNRTNSMVDDESKKSNVKPICVQIKPEYLGDWGCEMLENQELELSWLGSFIRNNSDILRIRLYPNSGKIILIEYQSMEEMLKTYPHFKPQDNVNRLSGLLDQLFNLHPGSYLLTQTKVASDNSFDIYQSVNDNQSFDIDARQINLNQISSQFSTSSERLLNLLSLGDDNFTGTTIPEEIASTLYLVRRLKLDLDIPAGFEKIHTLQNAKSERNLKLPGLNRMDCMENCSKQNSSSSESIKTLTSDKTNKTRVMKVTTSKKRTTTKPIEKNSTKGRQLPTPSKNANDKHRSKRQRIN